MTANYAGGFSFKTLLAAVLLAVCSFAMALACAAPRKRGKNRHINAGFGTAGVRVFIAVNGKPETMHDALHSRGDFTEILPLIQDFMGVADPASPATKDPTARKLQLLLFVRLLPGLTLGNARLIRPFRRPTDRERFLTGLRKAGLPE